MADTRTRAGMLAALLLAAPAAAQHAGFDAVRTSGETVRERAGERVNLYPRDLIDAGDRLHTGSDGHLLLQLAPVGQLTLGPGSALLVHSLEPAAPPARMGLARLVLEHGRLRADARAQSPGLPADLRLNVGALRLRIFGAEAWIERSADGDEVCLLSGAIELQTPDGPQRLDLPGSCLQATRNGLQHLPPAAASPLAPRLARTAFPGDYVSHLAAARAAAPPAGALRTEAPASAAPAAAPAWTIVLASLPDPARAQAEAQRLRADGLDTRVLAAQRADGLPTYRVVAGRYASKAAAAAQAGVLRAQRPLGAAWVARE